MGAWGKAPSTSAAQNMLIRQLFQNERSRLADQIRLYPDSRQAMQHAAAYFLAAPAEVPSERITIVRRD